MAEQKKDDGLVDIHGKLYKTVALRVTELREKHSDWTIKTKILDRANLILIRASIIDEKGRLIGTGHAEEERDRTQINKTSALENCETSAIGRALAACGWGGTGYASADELAQALAQQQEKKMNDIHARYMQNVMAHIRTITVIQNALAENNLSVAAEAWFELSEDDQKSIWRAYSKGGCFTTAEQNTIKTTEFRKAYYGEETPDPLPSQGVEGDNGVTDADKG